MNREFAKGMAKVKENDFLTAIEHFTLALRDDPNDVESYAERAVAYLNTQQYELSMFDMNRCIEIEPNNSYRYSCRGFLKAKIGDVDGAIVDYEMAVKLDPEDAIAYNNLGLAQESKGFRAHAEKSYQQSNKLIGYNPNRFDEGEIKEPQTTEQKKDQTETESHEEKIIAQTETENSDVTEIKNPTKGEIAKGVFTSKSGFREFLKFIRNGFRIKE